MSERLQIKRIVSPRYSQLRLSYITASTYTQRLCLCYRREENSRDFALVSFSLNACRRRVNDTTGGDLHEPGSRTGDIHTSTSSPDAPDSRSNTSHNSRQKGQRDSEGVHHRGSPPSCVRVGSDCEASQRELPDRDPGDARTAAGDLERRGPCAHR